MIYLPNSLAAWPGEGFSAALKAELSTFPPPVLSLSRIRPVGANPITVTVLHIDTDTQVITARLGIFYTEILAGCSCGDEPQPEDCYGEFELRLDRSNGQAELAEI